MDFAYRNDYLIDALGPENVGVLPQAAGRLLDAASGAVCRYWVLDSDAQTVVTATAGSPFTVIPVALPALFLVGQGVEVIEATGGIIKRHLIASIQSTTVTLDTGLTTAPAIGTKMRRILGPLAGTAMIEFGVPRVGSKAWGFRGQFDWEAFPNLVPGKAFQISKQLVGSGGSLDWTDCRSHIVVACDGD